MADAPERGTMSTDDALAFVREKGVVLVSARGLVPRMTEVIAGEAIGGSWWAHAKSHAIFRVLQALGDSPEILVCRLVDGKVTFVHRRLWPAVIRAATRFPPERLARVDQEHTPSGRHVNREVAFPGWADAESLERAGTMSEEEALAALGPWATPKATAKAPKPAADARQGRLAAALRANLRRRKSGPKADG
jgi:hypothetical protein